MILTTQQPWPGELINLNDRDHWSVKAKKVAAWRDATYWWAKQQHWTRVSGFATVDILLGVKDPQRRRDNSNWQMVTKSCVDGLVLAGVLEEDDSTRVLQNPPSFTNLIPPRTVAVTITVKEN